MYGIAEWSHEMRLSLYLVECPQSDFGEIYLLLQREMLQKRAWERKLQGRKLSPILLLASSLKRAWPAGTRHLPSFTYIRLFHSIKLVS